MAAAAAIPHASRCFFERNLTFNIQFFFGGVFLLVFQVLVCVQLFGQSFHNHFFSVACLFTCVELYLVINMYNNVDYGIVDC